MYNVTPGLSLYARSDGYAVVAQPATSAPHWSTADRARAADPAAARDVDATPQAADADELSLAYQHSLVGDARLEREDYGGRWRDAGLLAVSVCVGVAGCAVYLGLGGLMAETAVWVSVIAITISFSCLVALLAVAQFHIFRLEQRVKTMEREIEHLQFELRRQQEENALLMQRLVGDHK